jgi:hypothetical protein
VAVLVGAGVLVGTCVLVGAGEGFAPNDPILQAKTNKTANNKTNKTFVRGLLCFMTSSPLAK